MKRIGETAAIAEPGRAIIETVSRELSTEAWASIDCDAVMNLPARLNDEQLAFADHVAALPVPSLPAASDDHFLKCLRTLQLLPSRRDDDLSGELRVNLYRRHLGRFPAPALSYLVERATATLKWFPTPSECLAILEGWQPRNGFATASRYAEIRAVRERQARLEDVRNRLMDGKMSQDEADALPWLVRRILTTEGHISPHTGKIRQRRLKEAASTDL